MSAFFFTVCLSGALFLTAQSVNPTAVCYYSSFTAKYFNIITEDRGTVMVDFSKELYAEISDVTGLKIVHDFQNLRSYGFRPEDGVNATCKASILPQSHVMRRCLPPYAKPVTPGTGNFGYHSSYKLAVDTWEVETDYDTVYRITFSTSYRMPVFLHEYGYHGTTNAYMYMNPTNSVASKAFELPADCITNPTHPSHVIVG